ncbi:hypothetical protein Bbelb_038950 [Branchiostoma belcheri]|nr:hypothetical protein Bbelb_038950 [Branchiostoma belcheri]
MSTGMRNVHRYFSDPHLCPHSWNPEDLPAQMRINNDLSEQIGFDIRMATTCIAKAKRIQDALNERDQCKRMREPVKSLGRLYTSDIDEAKRSQELRKQAVEGLEAIDRCELPGKLKVWCLQSVLLPRLKWPMKIYEIPLTTADQIEAKTNSFIRKWLGVPRCLSRIALAGRNMLTLPINSVTEEYKLDKVRMTLELMWSKDNAVKAAYRRQKTGRKWNPEEAINQAISRLKHRDIVGAVQRGRTGLGWGERTQRWERATQTERKQLVVEEVKRMEEEGRKVCAVSQKQQGAWVNWEDCLDRKLTWNDVWKIPDCRLSFLIRAVYDVLPCPRNLSRVDSPGVTTKPSGSWQQPLKSEGSSEETQKQTFIPFVKEGQRATQGVRRSCEGLMRKGEWEMAVDLDKRLVFPRNICETTLRPDIVLWSSVQKTVLVIELTIPWEENIQAAYERKKLKYQELVQQCAENGWRSLLYPVEKEGLPLENQGVVVKMALQRSRVETSALLSPHLEAVSD